MQLAEVRFSHLRAYGRSAMHGRHARTAQETTNRPMELGEAVHAIRFGNKKVCGFPGKKRQGKEYDKFAADHPEYVILTMSEYDKAQRMADAVNDCQLAAPYLKGVYEETLRFKWMGLDCRATPDVCAPSHLTELKTSASSEPVKFTYQALRMHYPAQMRMQQLAVKDKDRPCYIVCVESEAPFPVTVFDIEPHTLEFSERLLITWAERLKNCELSNTFPGYLQSVFTISQPEEFTYEEAA